MQLLPILFVWATGQVAMSRAVPAAVTVIPALQEALGSQLDLALLVAEYI